MLKRAIVRSTVGTSTVLGGRLFVQAGTLLVLARMLGSEEFAIFAGISALAVMLGTLSTFGTHLVLLGEISKDKTTRDSILAYAIPTTLIFGSTLLFIFLCLGYWFFHNIFFSIIIFLCIGISELILLPLLNLIIVEEIALEKTIKSQLIALLPLILRFFSACLIFFIEAENKLLIFFISYLLTSCLTLVIVKILISNAFRTLEKWVLPSRVQLKNSAGYAALACSALGPNELDKILAVKLLPLNIGGIYIAASRIVGAATLPVIALILSIFPRLFRMEVYDFKNTSLSFIILKSVFIYGLLLSSLLWSCASFFEILFGKKYAGIGEMLQWFCLAIPALTLRTAIGSLLVTMSQPWLRASFEILGIIFLFAASLALYPYFDGKGIVIALTGAEWGMVMIGLYALKYLDLNSEIKNNLSRNI